MKNKDKITLRNLMLMFLVGFIFFSCIQSISAETELQPINKEVELKFTCTLNNAIPSASAKYNITVSYPNGSTYLDNVQTTALGNGAFSYNTNFTEIGLYKVQMFCYDGTYSFSNEGYYEVTNTGFKLDTSKSIVLFIGFGIMLLIGILLFIFGIYTKGIIKVFVIGLSILILFFSFGSAINIYSIGLGEYSNLTDSLDGLYFLLTILLSVGGIGLILFLIAFALKSFSKSRGFED